MFVASIQLQRETGGNLAELLVKLSDIIRAKATLRKKVWAVSAEGRISLFIVGGLPVVVVGAIMLLRPAFYLEVSSDPLFVPMMAFPPVLLLIGILIMWKMINFKV
jgi:tight adherence protein B